MAEQERQLEQTEDALRQLATELPPGPKIESASPETTQEAEQEAASFNTQDTLQADLVEGGVGGETAESAAAVLAQEQVDPANDRSLEEQAVLTEAYVQLQQDYQVEQIQDQTFDLQASATEYVALGEVYQTETETYGYLTEASINASNAASDIYQNATQQGVSGEEFYNAVEEVDTQQQQQRVEQTAPIVIDLLNAVEKDEYIGVQNTARYDEATQTLTVEENATGNQFISAQWDGNQWQDRGSSLTAAQVQYFQEDLQPQIASMQEMKKEKEREMSLD